MNELICECASAINVDNIDCYNKTNEFGEEYYHYESTCLLCNSVYKGENWGDKPIMQNLLIEISEDHRLELKIMKL